MVYSLGDPGNSAPPKRYNALVASNMSNYFIELIYFISSNRLTPEQIWNIDETFLSLNVTTRRVVVEKGSRGGVIMSKSYNTANHISMISLINANGFNAHPIFILPLKKLPANLVEYCAHASFIGTKSGWITNEKFRDIMNVVVHSVLDSFSTTRFDDLQTPHFIVSDGHRSRLDTEMLTTCQGRNHHIILIPAHTSSACQPLDRKYFKNFKQYLKNYAVNMPTILTEPIKRKLIIEAAISAQNKAGTMKDIKDCFEMTGIFPYNPFRVFDFNQVQNDLSEEVSNHIHQLVDAENAERTNLAAQIRSEPFMSGCVITQGQNLRAEFPVIFLDPNDLQADSDSDWDED